MLSFDKQLLDTVRTNPEAAKALEEVAKIPAEFSSGSWTFHKSEPNGGLRFETQRRFSNVEALNEAVRALRRDVDQSSSAAASLVTVFKDFEIHRTSGFLKSQTRVSGIADVTPSSLFGRTDIPASAQKAISDFFASQATPFFKFRVRADLPGKVTSTTGDPKISGGSVVWSPTFGRELRFSAAASSYNPFALLLIGVPLAGGLAVGASRLFARRRRGAPVPGWEVGAPAPASDAPARPAPDAAAPPPSSG